MEVSLICFCSIGEDAVVSLEKCTDCYLLVGGHRAVAR